MKYWIPKLLGLFLFDIVWISAVVGRSDWLGLTAVLVSLQVGLALFCKSFNGYFYLLLVALGLLLETIVVSVGLLHFTGGFLPLWLILLWFGFVGMLMNTLAGLAGRPLLAALLGAIFGPLTYAFGIRLDAAELMQEVGLMWGVYGVLWAVYMLIFAVLAPRYLQCQGNNKQRFHPNA